MRKFKIKSSKLKVALFLSLCFSAALLLCSSSSYAELTINANHDHIKIDFFYHGTSVNVSGTSEPNTDLIIKISSPEGHEALKQKGRVGGILWMNVGTLKFEKIPTLYMILTSKKIEDMLDAEEMNRHLIGYPALGRHIEISPVSKEEEKSKWFNEFVKYKEASKLYANSSGKIATEQKGKKQFYYIKADWPYQAPPGDYIVTVYAVKNKKIIEKAETKVFVEQVGIVKRLSGMAKDNGALYGIISIVAALGAGFGVGMIFRKGGGAH